MLHGADIGNGWSSTSVSSTFEHGIQIPLSLNVLQIVIAFCVGTAFFTSLLGIFTGETFSDTANNPLEIIANSFSNGAVFFVSYTILVIATQCTSIPH